MIFVFLFGAGFAKLAPLLFGLFLSNKLGSDSYVSFVNFLVSVNLLTSISTVSYTQLILSSSNKDPEAANQQVLSAIHFAAIVSLIGGGGVYYGSVIFKNDEFSIFAIILYSFGNSILALIAASYNARLANSTAGLVNFVAYALAYGVSLIALTFNSPLRLVLILLSLMILLSGIFLYLNSSVKIVNFRTIKNIKIPFIFDHVNIIVFVGGILYSHANLLSQVAYANSFDLAAAFSVGYQLFAIGIFIPSALANVMVPKLGRGDGFDGRLMLFYLAMPILWCIFIYITADFILSLYGISKEISRFRIIEIMQLGVIFCSLHALMNQLFAAKKRYILMAMSSVVYVIFLLYVGSCFDYNAVAMAWSFVCSYAAVLTFDLVMSKAGGQNESKESYDIN
jgi:O-antigen/teichoic acid export membrane protein